jgi:hypothetical protein
MFFGRKDFRISNQEKWRNNIKTLSVGLHLLAPYVFWKHANNNFLEGTNYNYSCTPITSPGKCKTDYVM